MFLPSADQEHKKKSSKKRMRVFHRNALWIIKDAEQQQRHRLKKKAQTGPFFELLQILMGAD